MGRKTLREAGSTPAPGTKNFLVRSERMVISKKKCGGGKGGRKGK